MALSDQTCIPIEPGSSSLSQDEIDTYLQELGHNWQLSTDSRSLYQQFRFNNYYETMAFVNATAWISHQQDHHPEISIHYNHCTISYYTHITGGLTLNDFICAARINQLPPAI